MAYQYLVSVVVVVFMFLSQRADAALSTTYYAPSCRTAESIIIRKGVCAAVKKEVRIGASLLRLHFHDCFVNGCDGSVLLDDTASFTGEKTAAPNNGSIRGFEVVDSIKAQLEKACPKVVSCADILAVAARDSVVALGGRSWNVPVGRKDSRTANFTLANNNLPAPNLNLSDLVANFANVGLSAKDMIVLSGGHTIGLARCTSFSDRFTATDIDASFATSIRSACNNTSSTSITQPLDRQTPNRFNDRYYKNLLVRKGLLHSDQQLFSGGGFSDALVRSYATNRTKFFQDFAVSMVNMGNILPATGTQGEVRVNCRRVN